MELENAARTCLVSVCISLLTLAPPAIAAERAAEEPAKLVNIAMHGNGVLSGSIVDGTGAPREGVVVTVRQRDNIRRVVADKEGGFTITGLQQGVCLIDCGHHSYACRLWHRHAAPPAASSSVLIVDFDSTVRGQNTKKWRRNGLRRLTQEERYGLAISAMLGTAAYFALDRDDAS